MKQEVENQKEVQTFSEYMRDFLMSISAGTVVEIGSDVQLRIAFGLAPYCKRFYSVNFPEDNTRMMGWYELQKDLGGENVELMSGNALKLSELVAHADVIILHNILLDLTGEDVALMHQYQSGELECSDGEWSKLVSRFRQAREDGYKEFLKVARPGYIVTFKKNDPGNDFGDFLINILKLDPLKIEKKELFYDDSQELWLAYIINNT